MHCSHCGTLLPDSAKFCTNCGQPIQPAPEAPDQEPIAAADQAPVSEEPAQDAAETYTAPENASEGYKAANAQLPPSYSNPDYSSTSSSSAYTGPAASSSTNVLAIVGFVCSLIIFPIALGALSAVAGLVLSILGLNNAKKLPENKGHGLALAGTIISAVRIILILIIIFAFLVLLLRGAGHVVREIIANWKDYYPFSY